MLPPRFTIVSDLFATSFQRWRDHVGPLTLLTILFCLLAWIPVLNIALSVGYIRYLLKLSRGEEADLGDLFRGWDCFLPALLYAVVLSVGYFLISLLPVLGVLLATLLVLVTLPGYVAVVENRMDVTTAFRWSTETLRSDPLNWGIILISCSFLFSLGALFFGLGLLITLPLATLIFICQYLRHQPDWY
ncbi:hypothetical protein HTZ97_06810 [Desulfuromonas acetoxidans]|uniref:Transmembrane protein n=1 Tax=Desulfuromonas acetoxidans (strain DSM 684 / 11070) TaxID=281689 RepID=Q1JVW7_DESA6|nr:hypothetical protein [Desulfuromonas acetoxidans]EAT14399.1 conserved hypothetical protein [Desulfuromonas acetoxidans DSM 684]MBF0646923.1 hypothetical protein [Desulfuromonas acetoxidans]NVD23874.1 hypothetical protein [Desulfuromonas acetoxidans]NVE16171.1 hypothetical protein [Desulfuromonas acetoxidans]